MSRGLAALPKDDQAAVLRWLELEHLARQVRPQSNPWPLLHLLIFLAGAVIGWLL